MLVHKHGFRFFSHSLNPLIVIMKKTYMVGTLNELLPTAMRIIIGDNK